MPKLLNALYLIENNHNNVGQFLCVVYGVAHTVPLDICVFEMKKIRFDALGLMFSVSTNLFFLSLYYSLYMWCGPFGSSLCLFPLIITHTLTVSVLLSTSFFKVVPFTPLLSDLFSLTSQRKAV